MQTRQFYVPMLVVAALLTSLSSESYGADAPPQTGTFTDSLKLGKNDEFVMKYKARVPEKLPETKTLGLIISFHGLTQNENSMFGPTTNPLKQLGLLDQYVVLCLKSRGSGWDKVDDKPVMKTIQWALKTYPIDPRRVHIYGFSSGGFMVTRFGWANQQHFATVIAYCGAFSTRWGGGRSFRPKGKPSETATEFYHVHGDSDKVVKVDMTRNFCRELGSQGYRYIYRELDGHTHGSIFRVKNLYLDIFQWVHATRNKIYPLSKDDKKILATMKSKIRTLKGPEALDFIREAARIGGAYAGKSLIYAFKSTDADVRLAAVKSAVTTSYGSSVVKELGRLITDKDPAIRAAAIEALGSAARWRQLDAQAILAKAATNRSASDEDKLAIIAELGKMFDLMILGNMEDKLIVFTLVKLLDDPKQPVRAAAFEHLKKAVSDGLSYSPDGDSKERRAGIGKWKKWAADATLKPLSGGYKAKG